MPSLVLHAAQTADVILGIAPAVTGLIGTLVGAGLTYHSHTSDRHAKADDEARAHLLDVSDAIHRAAWLHRFGASRPQDLGPDGIEEALRSSVRAARPALLTAGVPYRVAAAALEPAERLTLRMGSMTMTDEDPDDAQHLVVFLLGVLDRRRTRRGAEQVWARLNAMPELDQGRRPIPGFSEGPPPAGA